jgi:hypothetical protein
MQDPTNTFGEGITRVDYTAKMREVEVSCFTPILNGKVLDIDVVGTFSWLVGIDHFNGRFIIFMNRGWRSLSKAKLGEDRAEVLATLAAETAAINTASVDELAVMVCVLERYAMAPPVSMKA